MRIHEYALMKDVTAMLARPCQVDLSWLRNIRHCGEPVWVLCAGPNFDNEDP